MMGRIAGIALVLIMSDGWAQESQVAPSPLLAIDLHRSTVIERVMTDWGAPLELSNAGITRAQLRTMLDGLRADHLLAASIVGSLTGLRDVLGTSLATDRPATSARVSAKALGDAGDDLVYTPVSPCRLFDTRSSQGGLGTPSLNVRRTYGAITPVTSQGGPGGCAAVAGAAVALIQIGTIAPSGSGILQGGPQGAASFPNALILYQAGDQYGTAVAMPLNAANGQFDLLELFAAADLYADLLGYFKPATGFVAAVTGGTGISVSGTTNPTLSLPASFQLPQACGSGQVAKSNGAGVWTCAADSNSGGTVTSVTAGAGLTGGTITGSGTIAVDPTSVTLTGNFFKQGGNAFAATAVLGTTDNNAVEIKSNGSRVMRYEPNANSPNVIGGHPGNSVAAASYGQTVAGGGVAGTTCYEPSTGLSTRNCTNQALQSYTTVGGGISNTASGVFSTVAGGDTNTAIGAGSTVAGGIANTANGGSSTVGGGGGLGNTCYEPSTGLYTRNCANQALQSYATVAGGLSNIGNGVSSVVGGGSNNTASGADATIGGGGANTASGDHSAIDGGTGNIASGVFSKVGGGTGNTASNLGATVGGGFTNAATGVQATVGGGNSNSAGNDNATVGGGIANIASGTQSMVGGGSTNTASGAGSTIGGGVANIASGVRSTVGGGNTNHSSNDYATIGGGIFNSALGLYSTVGGGNLDVATADYAVIGGGLANSATGLHATIGGGNGGSASGNNSTVGGGFSNTASGGASTVPGGNSNIASGQYSFAAGRRAVTQSNDATPIIYDGTFIFADWSNFDFNSAHTDEFAVRATGGVRFVTAIGGAGGPTWTCGVSGGSGGSWGCSSDRNLKAGLVPYDSAAVLDRLVALPVYRWFAKDDARQTPHAGPMAQDFMASFGLGDNDRMIGFADAQGVAFSAIQGLNRKLEARLHEDDVKIAELEARVREIEALRNELSAVRRLVNVMAGEKGPGSKF